MGPKARPFETGALPEMAHKEIKCTVFLFLFHFFARYIRNSDVYPGEVNVHFPLRSIPLLPTSQQLPSSRPRAVSIVHGSPGGARPALAPRGVGRTALARSSENA